MLFVCLKISRIIFILLFNLSVQFLNFDNYEEIKWMKNFREMFSKFFSYYSWHLFFLSHCFSFVSLHLILFDVLKISTDHSPKSLAILCPLVFRFSCARAHRGWQCTKQALMRTPRQPWLGFTRLIDSRMACGESFRPSERATL